MAGKDDDCINLPNEPKWIRCTSFEDLPEQRDIVILFYSEEFNFQSCIAHIGWTRYRMSGRDSSVCGLVQYI